MMPESPVFLLSKGKENAARKSLQWLRGSKYDLGEEIEQVNYQTCNKGLILCVIPWYLPSDEDKCTP